MKNNWIQNREQKIEVRNSRQRDLVEELTTDLLKEIDKEINADFLACIKSSLNSKSEIKRWGTDVLKWSPKITVDHDNNAMTIMVNKSNFTFSIEAYQDLTSVYSLDASSIIAGFVLDSVKEADECQ